MHHYPMAGPRSRYAYSRIVASPQQFLHTSLGYPQEVASPHLSVDSVSAEWYPIFTEVRRLSKSCKISSNPAPPRGGSYVVPKRVPEKPSLADHAKRSRQKRNAEVFLFLYITIYLKGSPAARALTERKEEEKCGVPLSWS